eukprot:scaffold31420_cov23-Tisochrysis_lutea.AAC.2
MGELKPDSIVTMHVVVRPVEQGQNGKQQEVFNVNPLHFKIAVPEHAFGSIGAFKGLHACSVAAFNERNA